MSDTAIDRAVLVVSTSILLAIFVVIERITDHLAVIVVAVGG